jgi:hypothetical protein
MRHILDKGLLGHMLNHKQDVRSIGACPRWCHSHIPDFLDDIAKDVEPLLCLDGINEILLISGNSGSITNPRGQGNPQNPVRCNGIRSNANDLWRVGCSSR